MSAPSPKAVRRPSAREIDLIRYPSIASQMPIVFASRTRWSTIKACCAHCEKQVDDDHFRGTITRLVPMVATVEGIAWCPSCKLWSAIYVRCRADMTVEGPSPRTGKWARWGGERRSLLSRVRRLLHRVFS